MLCADLTVVPNHARFLRNHQPEMIRSWPATSYVVDNTPMTAGH